ncbi:ClpXP protease specificity-enhancing factor [Azoarcus indigens]|uniref:Stringent starvation protein B n=1 Tax=Azoarcus indigens TaxID=29545 RepID=A0A4R6DYF3_9RHOO|nr:ClpXP protease specificity-enhancing factor [Azoarcus indigens]NMG66362.1 ClpXP protease specificity-enhancing factor [Azoarcus indigens]TDN50343.1 stringent starvation protein B [Azoarcus indigens]
MTTVSTKPYLIRAIYEWCVDQGFTPYIAAMVDEQTRVPPGYARDGQIVLNVGADATHQLVMDNESISFQARFNGVAHSLLVPVGNVVAIYARENGQGMAFEVEKTEISAPAGVDEELGEALSEGEGGDDRGGNDDKPPPRGGHLKIVK